MRILALIVVLGICACSPNVVPPKSVPDKPTVPRQMVEQCITQPELPWCQQACVNGVYKHCQ